MSDDGASQKDGKKLERKSLSRKKLLTSKVTDEVVARLNSADITLSEGAVTLLTRREKRYALRMARFTRARRGNAETRRRQFEIGMQRMLDDLEAGSFINTEQMARILSGLCPGFPPFC